MDQIPSSFATQEPTQIDLDVLAKATIKTFERLAPFSQLETSAPPGDAKPFVAKIVKKISAYLCGIDSSILAVQIAHRLSSDTVALCNLAAEQDDQESSFALVITESDRRTRLDGLLNQAEDACEKALKAKETFREVEQDLYKIAAATKDSSSVVQIPVAPARPRTITKPLKDVASDLVANLGLLTEFSLHTSQLVSWCGAIKAELAADNGLSLALAEAQEGADLAHLQSMRTRWIAIKKDTLKYHKAVKTLQTRYSDLLPTSSLDWTLANESNIFQRTRRVRHVRGHSMKALNIIRDSAMHLLAFHGPFLHS